MSFDRHYGDRKQLYFHVYNLAEKVFLFQQPKQPSWGDFPYLVPMESNCSW